VYTVKSVYTLYFAHFMIKAKPERQANRQTLCQCCPVVTNQPLHTSLVLWYWLGFCTSQVKDNTIGPFVNNSFGSESG